MLSPELAATYLPSAEKFIEPMYLSKFFRDLIALPDSISHTLIKPIASPLIMYFPSGDTFNVDKISLCPSKVFINCPLEVSQILTV